MGVLEADYLVVGAGASGMAFVDSLIGESEAEVVLVDRRHRPGGHWNDDYPFVRLHQPSALYGVASRPLGDNRIDEGVRPQMAAFHLQTEPWLFVFDGSGKVAARIEGAFSERELEQAIAKATG